MLLVTWRCCSPAWPLLNEKRPPPQKKTHFKEGGVPEHPRLHNRHGPMVAQRCLGAKTNFPRKFALVSCFELPKRTQYELHFGLILFEITSYQFVLRFCLKYIGAFRLLFHCQRVNTSLSSTTAWWDVSFAVNNQETSVGFRLFEVKNNF